MTQTAFETLIALTTLEEQTSVSETVQSNFESRMVFENMERPGNDAIQVKLKASAKKLAPLGVASVMLATEMDLDFVNRSLIENRRFNIYSVDKVADLLTGLASGKFNNAVNLAVMRSMFKFRAAGMDFNTVAVLGAVSDKVKIETGMKAVLIRHTVSAATAPTQASSTMNALQAIHAVINTGTAKAPMWHLNTNATVDQLEKLVA